MKRVFTLISVFVGVLLLIASKITAQPASSYGFQALSGTFTEITGTPFIDVEDDDVLPTATIPLGFSFNFCGTTYTTIRAGSNGYMSFTSSAENSGFNDEFELEYIRPALMWLWDDLDGSSGTAVYATSGIAPNRVFTMQYKFWNWNWSATGPNVSVQIKLYETTNVIEYVYRQDASAGNPSGSNGASIGIVDHDLQNTFLSLNNSLPTAVVSSNVFTEDISVRPVTGQIFRFSPPLACDIATGMPSAGATTAFPASFCQSGKPNLRFTPATPMPATTGVTYQWQSAPAATGPWTDIAGASTTNPNYTLGVPITVATYFRCAVKCLGTTIFNSSSVFVDIETPPPPTAANVTRCGSGAVTLTANGFAGSSISWYAAPTGGLPLHVGNTFTTPNLGSNTDYYVSASNPPVVDTTSIGNGSLFASASFGPFYGLFGGYKHEFILTEAELSVQGIVPGSVLNSVSMWRESGAGTYNGFTLSVGTTAATTLGSSFVTGTIPVFGPVNYTTSGSRMLFTFNTPYVYNGGSLVLQTCWSNNASSAPSTYLYYDATTSATVGYAQADNVTPTNMCSRTSSNTYNYRPKFTFEYEFECGSVRTPVSVIISTPPVLTTTFNSILCNNEIEPIEVTSALANYDSYLWESLNGSVLFTDALATNGYASTSEAVVYFKSLTPGLHKIVLTATNSVTTCGSIDTLQIFVQPNVSNIAILGLPDSICNSGTTQLNLSNLIYNEPTSVWQTSTDGVTYSNLTVGSLPYSSPILTAHQYYRLLLNKNASVACDTINKMIFVGNPLIDSVAGAGICGPGSVNLYARANDNGSVAWYESLMSNTPVFVGNNFVTPYITSSTTYYAAAQSSMILDSASIGAGASTGTSTYSPFNGGWGGYKYEFLITEAELAAIGLMPGSSIRSLSFWQSSGTNTYNGFTLSLGTTTASALSTTFQTGVTPVMGPINYTTNAGRLLMAFASPYIYTGGNLVVQTCWSNNNTSNTVTHVRYDATPFESSHYYYGDNVPPSTICGFTSGGSTWQMRPKFTFEFDKPCQSARVPVVANISDRPYVDLGPDVEKCVDNGHMIYLNAQNPGLNYVWDDGYNGQIRVIDRSGVYWVNVDNGLGCSTTDTVNILLKTMPMSMLGNDTTVCRGAALLLDAGNDGIGYFWSTGATANRINVTLPDEYIVQIRGANGCIKTDTIVVTHSGELPTFNSVNVTNLGIRTFKFTLRTPRNISNYSWDFGDGSPLSFAPEPTHTFPSSGNYLVFLNTYSSCGAIADTIPIYVYGTTGINDVDLSNNIKVYPNPAQHSLKVEVLNDALINDISIINALGQLIRQENYDNQRSVVLNLDGYTSGMYQLLIQTNKGLVTRKVAISK